MDLPGAVRIESAPTDYEALIGLALEDNVLPPGKTQGPGIQLPPAGSLRGIPVERRGRTLTGKGAPKGESPQNTLKDKEETLLQFGRPACKQ
ncbi:hypothetical protein ACOMHN_054246 [Nucella lapillus]